MVRHNSRDVMLEDHAKHGCTLGTVPSYGELMTTHTLVILNIEVMQAMTVLRHRSINTLDQTSHVITASLQNLSQAGQGAMPAM